MKAAFGQMGEEMLLAGQRVAPRKLEAAGFTFAQPDIDSGLALRSRLHDTLAT